MLRKAFLGLMAVVLALWFVPVFAAPSSCVVGSEVAIVTDAVAVVPMCQIAAVNLPTPEFCVMQVDREGSFVAAPKNAPPPEEAMALQNAIVKKAENYNPTAQAHAPDIVAVAVNSSILTTAPLTAGPLSKKDVIVAPTSAGGHLNTDLVAVSFIGSQKIMALPFTARALLA